MFLDNENLKYKYTENIWIGSCLYSSSIYYNGLYIYANKSIIITAKLLLLCHDIIHLYAFYISKK